MEETLEPGVREGGAALFSSISNSAAKALFQPAKCYTLRWERGRERRSRKRKDIYDMAIADAEVGE